jgi:hypothetical protein
VGILYFWKADFLIQRSSLSIPITIFNYTNYHPGLSEEITLPIFCNALYILKNTLQFCITCHLCHLILSWGLHIQKNTVIAITSKHFLWNSVTTCYTFLTADVIILHPWKSGNSDILGCEDSSKHWKPLAQWHSIKYQRTQILSNITMKTSILTWKRTLGHID